MIPVICGSGGGAMVPVRSVYVGGYVCIDVRGGYRNFLRGGTVNKSYKKVGVDPKRGWVREGDMPPPARSAEAFDTI